MINNDELKLLAFLHFSGSRSVRIDNENIMIFDKELGDILKGFNVVGWDYKNNTYIVGNYDA